jgi:hypothetical protein
MFGLPIDLAILKERYKVHKETLINIDEKVQKD